MRAIFGFAAALLAAVVPLASAQAQELPQCAASCLLEGISQSACATNMTQACICTNAPLQHQITLCVTKSCTILEALVTKNVTSTTCGAPVRNRGETYNTTNIILACISMSIVVIRLAFKIGVTRSLSSDDYVNAALVLFSIPSVIITHYGTTPNGVGRDIWTLTPKQITDFQFYFYLMAVLYFIHVMLVKLCLLLFYLRIFPDRRVRRLLWGTVIFDVIFGVLFFFLAIFQCKPVSYFWQGWDGEHEGMCLNKGAIAWANAAISIALDFWMLAIPLAQLKTLKLHWKKKIGVALMFCVGTFVTVVSIIRLQALVTFAKSSNATWDNFPVSLWSTVEINVGIMCTCMPTLRLLLVRLFPRLGGGSSYGTGGGGGGYYASGGGNRSGGRSGAALSASGKMRSGKRRTLVSNLTSRSTHVGTNHTTTGSDETIAVPPKSAGIVRQQTFAVQYDDDETSLMQMRGLHPGGSVISHKSDKSDDLA